MQLLPVAFLFLLTLMPVESRWAEADVWLLWSLPAITAIGVFCMFITRKTLTVTMTDKIAAVWFSYYIIRMYVGGEYPCATEFLKICTTALLYASLRLLFANNRISVWGLITTLLICGSYEAVNGVLQMINGTSRHHLFLITGNFQNPGPYSAYLMIGAVVGICTLREKIEPFGRIDFKKILLTLTAVMLVVLPSTWSRAAFVGLCICALLIYPDRYWKFRYYVCGALCLLFAALYFIKQGSADGRTMIWMSSLISWSHTPWLGVGIGGFRHACAEGIAELWHSNPDLRVFYAAGVTDYAYNAILKVLVEQGIVGATLCLVLTVSTMIKLHSQSRSLFMGVFSLLIFSMFSYPFELLPYRIIVVVIVTWSQSNNGKAVSKIRMNMSTIVSALTLSIVSIMVCKEVTHRSDVDKDSNLFSGMHNEAFIDDYYELLPDELDNPQFLFDFAKTLRESKRYRDSNAILRMGGQVSADPMFYVIIGNNYRDESFYDYAEKAYNKAFSIMPNRLYPLYQLMLMHRDNKEIHRSKNIAKQIIELKPKIQSTATDEMKQKANKIITK